MSGQAGKPVLEIEPFWRHLLAVLKYPARQENLIAVGVLSVLGFLAAFSWLLTLLVWMAAFTYAYGVLGHTARGYLEPRVGYFDRTNNAVSWQQLGLWLLLGVGIAAAGARFGTAAGVTAAIFVLVALPIATMVLAINQSVVAALNPLTWVVGIHRIGRHYPALLGLLALFALAPATAWAVFGSLPYGLGELVFNFVMLYCLVAVFYLLGYVIYQYHDAFGFDPDADALERRERSLAPAGHPALAQAERSIAAGEPEQAKAALRAGLAEEGALSEMAGRYRELCEATGDTASLLDLHRDQLIILLANEDFEQAIPVMQRSLELDPGFKLAHPEQVLPLAKFIAAGGNSRLALQLAHGFAASYPGHKDRIGNDFLAARILSDRMGRDAESLKILRSLERDFPKHPQRQVIVDYRREVERRVTPQNGASKP